MARTTLLEWVTALPDTAGATKPVLTRGLLQYEPRQGGSDQCPAPIVRSAGVTTYACRGAGYGRSRMTAIVSRIWASVVVSTLRRGPIGCGGARALQEVLALAPRMKRRARSCGRVP